MKFLESAAKREGSLADDFNRIRDRDGIERIASRERLLTNLDDRDSVEGAWNRQRAFESPVAIDNARAFVRDYPPQIT